MDKLDNYFKTKSVSKKNSATFKMASISLFVVFMAGQTLFLPQIYYLLPDKFFIFLVIFGMFYALIFMPIYIVFLSIAAITFFRKRIMLKINAIALFSVSLVMFLNNIGFDYKEMRYLKNSEVIDLALKYRVEWECMFSKTKSECLAKEWEPIKQKYATCLNDLPDVCDGLYKYKGAKFNGVFTALTVGMIVQNGRIVEVEIGRKEDDWGKKRDIAVKSKGRVDYCFDNCVLEEINPDG